MIKRLLVLGLALITVNANAETLHCFYPSNTLTGVFYIEGHVISVIGDRFVFKGNNGKLITSSLVNCYIEA